MQIIGQISKKAFYYIEEEIDFYEEEINQANINKNQLVTEILEKNLSKICPCCSL